MGISTNGPSHTCGDNKSVLVNSSERDSVLKKKSVSIAHNFVREGSTAGEWRVSCVDTELNIADLLTKSLGGEAGKRLISRISHHVCEND